MQLEFEIEGPADEVEAVIDDIAQFAHAAGSSIERGAVEQLPDVDRSAADVAAWIAIVVALPGAIHDGAELYRRWRERSRQRLEQQHPRVLIRDPRNSEP